MIPPTATARPEVVTRELRKPRQAWIERATSADHKVVGQLYIATALTFLALAVTQFTLMRIQLIVPENDLLKPEIFNRLMTGAVTSFSVLGVVPLALGLIGYIVPLQIGARGVALPRLNQLSYYLYLAGGFTILASFLYSAPETGTAALPPLSDLVFSPSNGADAWIVGTGLAVLGFVCFAINLVVTVRKMRAPGLAWRRLPPFSWAATVIGYLLLIAGPAMLAALTMLEIDRRFDGVFFDPQEGGAPLLYEHLSYIFLTAIYLIVFLAAAGTISEILSTFARKPIFSRRAIASSFVAVGVLGLLAWMQNMYIGPLNEGWTIMAMAFALALVIPIGVIFFNWIATIWGGTVELRAATWYALAAIAMLSFGLAGELGYSVIPVGWALDNTTASQGDTLYVLVGGGVIGGFAGLHYWFPKLVRAAAGRGPRQDRAAHDRCRAEPLRDPYVPRRARGPAGRRLQVLREPRRRRSQPDRLDRRLHPRDRDPARARQRRLQLEQRAPRPRPRSVGRLDPGVVRALAAPAPQLRRRPRCPQRRTAARHPRIGRDPRARVHAADRARPGRRGVRRGAGSGAPRSAGGLRRRG